MDIVRRIQDILLRPDDTWPTIASEPGDVGSVYRHYLLILAAIPAIAGFVGMSLIGIGFFGFHMQVPVLAGLSSALLRYLLTLAMIYVLALVVDALAASFGGTRDRQKAFKLVAYAATAGLVGGIFSLIPALAILGFLAALYSIYLFYVGLPVLMNCPRDKALAYTAVVGVLSIVIGLVIGSVAGAAASVSRGFGGWSAAGAPARVSLRSGDGDVSIDTAKIADAAKRMQAVADAQAQAVNASTAGGVAAGVLPADALKGFLPETLGDWKRESIEAVGAGNGAVSAASATYRQGERNLHLSITDVGGGLGAAAAMWSALTMDRDSDGEVEKVYHDGARSMHEKYRKDGSSAEYQVVLANGTMVAAEGDQIDLPALKSTVDRLDVARLEGLQRPAVAAKP